MTFSPILALFIATVAMGIGFGIWSFIRTRRAYDDDGSDSLTEAEQLADRAERLTN
ncbi:MAG: hypothetical protein R3200_09695 [Xanthomonadales bacterium]|nr:hypothetical protein [Xanthomonadales bacterium]